MNSPEVQPIATVPQAPPAMPLAIASDEPQDITVIASKPEEMYAAQSNLIGWARRRLDQARAEEADLKENLAIAEKNKWGTGGISRAYSRAIRLTEYYEKILAALEAGYVLVPNFPVEIFAIRTTRKKPSGSTTTVWQGQHRDMTQESSHPPVGYGEYVSPDPEIWHRNLGQCDAKNPNKDVHEYFAKVFQEVQFPFTVAKPVILDATERAMALKVFDQVGALPGPKRKGGDPIIVGQIELAGRPNYNRKFVTFLVAWFIDTKDL